VIGFKGKQLRLGDYINKDDAVKARRKAEEDIWQPFLDEYHKNKDAGNS